MPATTPQIAELLAQAVGNDFLYFDSALVVKTTPHTHPVNIWGASVSPAGEVYVMDADQEWHSLEGASDIVIGSLYQRVKSIAHLYSVK